MPQIIPIKDLKNTAAVSEMCHQSDEPIFVTKNGYGDMVLMSMEAYSELRSMGQLYEDIALSEEQIQRGQTRSARQSLAEMKRKYDL